MRAAEAKLLALAQSFGGRDPSSYDIELFDTRISRSCVPFKKQKAGEELTIHGVRLSDKEDGDENKTETPLVIQHGYMNGALYFYRNLVGLTSHFRTVYAIDMLGWGLSSRPSYKIKDDSVETTEEFFVESLEAWRAKNGIEKMILAGHSMGGYMSVAYCEKYPERVERLILLSPAGVPTESQQIEAFQKNASFSQRIFISLYTKMFESGTTPCSVIRKMPSKKAQASCSSYVKKRLPAITDPEEQATVSDYLYYNSVLPASGEHCLSRVLNPTSLAKKPLIHRIPLLKVPNVSFLYGETDWMDSNGGIQVQLECDKLCRRRGKESVPKVDVYSVRDAGHLLMLDNWREFNAGIIASVFGKQTLQSHVSVPVQLSPRLEEAQRKFERVSLRRAPRTVSVASS